MSSIVSYWFTQKHPYVVAPLSLCEDWMDEGLVTGRERRCPMKFFAKMKLIDGTLFEVDGLSNDCQWSGQGWWCPSPPGWSNSAWIEVRELISQSSQSLYFVKGWSMAHSDLGSKLKEACQSFECLRDGSGCRVVWGCFFDELLKFEYSGFPIIKTDYVVNGRYDSWVCCSLLYFLAGMVQGLGQCNFCTSRRWGCHHGELTWGSWWLGVCLRPISRQEGTNSSWYMGCRKQLCLTCHRVLPWSQLTFSLVSLISFK